jgi:hypothetical protein
VTQIDFGSAWFKGQKDHLRLIKLKLSHNKKHRKKFVQKLDSISSNILKTLESKKSC